MASLIFENDGRKVELQDGSPIGEACAHAGVPIACRVGVCGVCAIRVTEGLQNLSPPTTEEIDLFGKDGTARGERLACQCTIISGTVRIKF